MKRTLLSLALLSFGLSSATAKPTHPKWPPKDYALHYGSWDDAAVQRAHLFDLVVAHPGDDFDNLNRSLIQRIKAGRDGQPGTGDDVVVLAYVTVGEDDKPPAGPPVVPAPAGPMTYANKTLKPTKAGYPTRYLDQVAYTFEKNGERKYGENGKPVSAKGQDGVPDENGVWGSYYVNAGDKEWQQMVLAKMRKLQDDYGVDGFFLDTLDTASPWGNYSYTQPQMAGMLKLIRSSFPDRFILGNRGMFLLDTHKDAFLSSLDGMLYESMFAIWDWGANRGIISPWVRGDYDYLKSPVLPASRQPGGFHLFYVNYLNPTQPNFYPLMHSVEDLVGRAGISNYVSDPLLQQLQPPISEIFPAHGSGAAPELGNLSATELPQGRFQLACEISGMAGRKLGQDLFLDVRVAREQPTVPAEIALLEEAYVDYSALPAAEGDRWKGFVQGIGLEQGTEYHLYARVVGKARDVRTEFLRVSFTTARTGAPKQVQELAATSLESSVRLSWKDPSGASSYKIYRGSAPNNLQAVGTTKSRNYVVSGLSNNQPVYFSVAALNAAGQEGSLLRPILARAEDCTPPSSPSQLQFDSLGQKLDLRWNAAPDAHIYKVYCLAPNENYRIPLRIAAPQTNVSLGPLARGKYVVWVTAVDSAGNESRRNQRVEVHIK
jgi:hypothetical protein